MIVFTLGFGMQKSITDNKAHCVNVALVKLLSGFLAEYLQLPSTLQHREPAHLAPHGPPLQWLADRYREMKLQVGSRYGHTLAASRAMEDLEDEMEDTLLALMAGIPFTH